MTTLSPQEILSKHGIAYIATKKSTYTTNCPNCGQGYLTVKIDREGVRFFCHDCQHGGGEYFEQRDAPKDERKRDAPKAVYDYEDEDGKRLYQSLRFEPIGKVKYFRQRLGPDQKKWSIEGVRLVPFHLPKLIEAVTNDEVIWIVEGEKDVLTLERHGIAATTNAMGACKWREEYNQHLAGADVVICGDNDAPGRRHVRQVAAALFPVARCVRVLDLKTIWSAIEESDDVSDWFERAPGASADLLREAIGDVIPLAEISPDDPEPRGNGHESDAAPPRFRQTSSQFVADFVPPDYLLDGVLQRRFLYSFTGRTGSGKTAVVLLLAASVALGRKIGDLEVAPGRVFYFCGENPDDVRMRWIALAEQMDFDIDTIDVHFFPGRFKISEMRERIIAEAGDVGGVVLVIVDTSAAYFEGEEPNNNKQQGEHANRLRTLAELPGGPCVLVNCHPVKNATADNLLPYGGGAFVNEVDGNLTCAISNAAIEVRWQGKFRGPDFEPLTFKVRSVTHERLKDSKGRLIPTVIAEHLSEIGQEEIAKVARSHEDQLLAEIEHDGRGSQADLARRCGWLIKTGKQIGKPHKTLVGRTLDALKKDKLITPDRGGYALTEKGRKARTKAGSVADQHSEPNQDPNQAEPAFSERGATH